MGDTYYIDTDKFNMTAMLLWKHA